MKVDPLTRHIGAELSGVNLGDAARDDALFQDIRALLLKHKVLILLQSQATVPEYQVRFRWKPNSVAIWDNRCTQHYAVHDYFPEPRKMERAAIMGDAPF